MTYDLHGSWDEVTGHHTALVDPPGALMSRNARSRENGEFDKILPRLLAKSANVVNLAKLAMQWRKWQI